MSEFPAVKFTNYAGLVDCFAQIKEHRNLSNQFAENMFGLANGHMNAIFTLKKRLGPLTLDAFCELFAVQFVMQPNPEAETRMKSRWEGRNTSQVRANPHLISTPLLNLAKQAFYKDKARQMEAGRKKIPADKRIEIARKAANARWRRNADPSAIGCR